MEAEAVFLMFSYRTSKNREKRLRDCVHFSLNTVFLLIQSTVSDLSYTLHFIYLFIFLNHNGVYVLLLHIIGEANGTASVSVKDQHLRGDNGPFDVQWESPGVRHKLYLKAPGWIWIILLFIYEQLVFAKG